MTRASAPERTARAGWRLSRSARRSALETVEADLLLVSGGWNPNVALWSQARGTLRFDDGSRRFVPDRPGPHGRMEAVGAAGGEIADLGRSSTAVDRPAAGRRTGEDAWPRTTSTSSATRPPATCAARSAPA